MAKATFVTTPGGEELAILPRRAYEDLVEEAAHGLALAEHRAGRDPGLDAEAMKQMLAAPTPLAFWRRHRGLSQAALAEAAGISQNHLSDLENGRRIGSIKLWATFARVLKVPIDSLVDDDA